MITNGFLNIEDGHALYYEHHGNIDKSSIIFIHGGPGMGFSEKDKALFELGSSRAVIAINKKSFIFLNIELFYVPLKCYL